MKKLDEAIKHAEEVAEENEKSLRGWEECKNRGTIGWSDYDKEKVNMSITRCRECAVEHHQLAEWLKDYKRLLEQQSKPIHKGTSLTADELAYMLMDERIMGELKQDISYSKDVIPDVKCVLNVSIQDRRPCYCGAELREVWRERKENEK